LETVTRALGIHRRDLNSSNHAVYTVVSLIGLMSVPNIIHYKQMLFQLFEEWP